MTGPDLHRTVGERLVAAGQRYSAVRRAVVDALRRSPGPLTMVELLACDAGIHQSTAYRALAVFEQLGVVSRLPPLVGDEARYELAEPFLAHHHHLICVACGAVRDHAAPEELERALQQAAAAAAADGFADVVHRLDFVGTCRRCV